MNVTIQNRTVNFRHSGRTPSVAEHDPLAYRELIEKMVKTANKKPELKHCQVKLVELHLSDWQPPVLYIWTQNITDRDAYYNLPTYYRATTLFRAQVIDYEINIKEF
jgi:hypothetical protein